jgi:hypothetical protein
MGNKASRGLVPWHACCSWCFESVPFFWCGGWDSNPRRPSPQGPKPSAGYERAFCPLDLALVPPRVRVLLTTDRCRWRIKTTLGAFTLHQNRGNCSDSSPTSAEQAPISIRDRRSLIIQIFTLDYPEKSHITKRSTRRFYARNRRTRLQQIQPERALKKKRGEEFFLTTRKRAFWKKEIPSTIPSAVGQGQNKPESRIEAGDSESARFSR